MTEHRLKSLCAAQVSRPVFLDVYPGITLE
jgi:hypothetical protein